MKATPMKQKSMRNKKTSSQIRRIGKKVRRKYTLTGYNGEFWQKDKTVKHNMARLGYTDDPNIPTEERMKTVEEVAEEDKKQLSVREENHRSHWSIKVEPQERMNIEDMLAKHGRDFVKMARDIKLNVYQRTPKQLEKRIAKYDIYVECLKKIQEEKKKKPVKQKEPEPAKKIEQELTEEEQEQKFYKEARMLGARKTPKPKKLKKERWF